MEFGEDFLHGAVEAIHGDGAFLAGFDETAEEFLAVQSFSRAIFFDDAKFGAFDLFVGRVAIATAEAFPPSPDGCPVL